MPLDPRMLAALAHAAPGAEPEREFQGETIDVDEARAAAAMLPDDSAAPRATPEEVERLTAPGVNYLEIIEPATGFSCGDCTYLDPGRDACRHLSVRAPVSPQHGCCNLYESGLVVWPVPSTPTGRG